MKPLRGLLLSAAYPAGWLRLVKPSGCPVRSLYSRLSGGNPSWGDLTARQDFVSLNSFFLTPQGGGDLTDTAHAYLLHIYPHMEDQAGS